MFIFNRFSLINPLEKHLLVQVENHFKEPITDFLKSDIVVKQSYLVGIFSKRDLNETHFSYLVHNKNTKSKINRSTQW